MAEKMKLVLEFTKPDATLAQIKRYVREAVNTWGGSYEYCNPFFHGLKALKITEIKDELSTRA